MRRSRRDDLRFARSTVPFGRRLRPREVDWFTWDWTFRKMRLLIESLGYVFGREGTMLVSSITFNFFLSLFPIIVLLLSAANYLEWRELREAVFISLQEFFPVSQDFIVRNLRIYTNHLGQPQLVSLVLIAWTGSALFFSLEAALDSAYRYSRPRKFWQSQLLGIGLVLVSGLLVLASISADDWLGGLLRPWHWIEDWLHFGAGRFVSFLLALTLFANVYLWLPSRRRPLKSVMTTSFLASLVWLGTNEFFRRLASSWSLEAIYGPFFVSITILLWAFATGCIVVGFARLEADGFFGR